MSQEKLITKSVSKRYETICRVLKNTQKILNLKIRQVRNLTKAVKKEYMV